MAKKKKSRKSRSSEKVKQTRVVQQGETNVVNIPRRAIDDDSFNPDYAPIIQDLKRIGALAAVFFVVLVVLSFIL
jgi:uncharacterized sporulation protein YeaH/YhbH (DUF444 family)